MIFADFLLPGSGSVSLKRIRIRIQLTTMKRIHTDQDPKHWGGGMGNYTHACKNIYAQNDLLSITLLFEIAFWSVRPI